MAENAKVIRIQLRVNGGGSEEPRERKERTPAKSKSLSGRSQLQIDRLTRKLAGAGGISALTQLYSNAISIGETLSYNSEEKTSMMYLNWNKKAISSAIVASGYLLGGPAGAALGLAINEFVVNPIAKGGAINIQRNLDQTRATNRFYQTNFAGRGTYTFDYSSGSYINSDLEKVRKGSFYKKGSVI